MAWTSKVMAGEKFEPSIDRHRGFTTVVVHLENGPAPAPSGPRYDYIARLSTSRPVRAASDEEIAPGEATMLYPNRGPRRRGSQVPRSIGPARGGGDGEEFTQPLSPVEEGSSMIEVINFTKRYGDFVAVDDLSFSIGKGKSSGSSAPTAPARARPFASWPRLLRPTSGEAAYAGTRWSTTPWPCAG